jgi:hypothetical protein
MIAEFEGERYKLERIRENHKVMHFSMKRCKHKTQREKSHLLTVSGFEK